MQTHVTKNHHIKNNIKQFFNNKNSLIIMIVFTVAFVIIGISLVSVYHPQYNDFVAGWGNINKLNGSLAALDPNDAANFAQIAELNKQIEAAKAVLPDITAFVYGAFFLAMGILMICFDALFANSIYNKKMKTI